MKRTEIHDVHPVYRPDTIELHLSKDVQFTRYYARHVNNAGGNYTRARKSDSKRYVQIPITERKLINDLLRKFRYGGKSTVILRGARVSRLPAWAVCFEAKRGQYLSDVLGMFNAALANAVARGIIKDGDTVVAEREEHDARELRNETLAGELADALENADTVEAFASVAAQLRELDSVRGSKLRGALFDRLVSIAVGVPPAEAATA